MKQDKSEQSSHQSCDGVQIFAQNINVRHMAYSCLNMLSGGMNIRQSVKNTLQYLDWISEVSRSIIHRLFGKQNYWRLA